MSKSIQAIKGMNDILPGESQRWEAFEATIRQWLLDYGYQNIRTPIVEQTDLFVRSIGEVTDIVEKEMYSFEDSLNGDRLTLRPEGTASCLRAVMEHGLLYNQTQRLWYMGPMFRHEKPQKGRYRQFHQLGVEALGFAGPDIDAEMLVMLDDLWKRLGVSGLQLQINTLGSSDERAQHRQALVAHLEKHADALDEEGRRRLYTNPLRVLDTKNPSMKAVVESAPVLMDYLGDESKAHFDRLKGILDAMGVTYVINPRLVRGLDYYNRTVFEWVTDQLGAQGTVCAGGRYDGLIEQLGGKPAPAIGFAIGIERMLLLLQTLGQSAEVSPPDVYVIKAGQGAEIPAFKFAAAARQAGLTVVMHCGEASFKSQMKKADASGARHAIIIGENEVSAGVFVVKALRAEVEQQSLSMADAIQSLTQK